MLPEEGKGIFISCPATTSIFQPAATADCSQLPQANATTLLNPETSTVIQKPNPYAGYLNTETREDNKNAFVHCRDVLAKCKSGIKV